MNNNNNFVIVRSSNSGVHAGFLVSQQGDTVVLKDARRLWRWVVAKMTGELATLSEVAVHGLNTNDSRSRISIVVPEITVLGVCEIIPASDKAKETIQKA